MKAISVNVPPMSAAMRRPSLIRCGSLAGNRDCVDFDTVGRIGERRDDDGGPRRIRVLEAAAIDGVHASKVDLSREIDGAAHDALKPAALEGQELLQIVEHLVGLQLDAAADGLTA